MNSIEVKIDNHKLFVDSYSNYWIDNYWLDEKLEELYPNNLYDGLIPTLLFGMEMPEEEKIVWDRILPCKNEITICPILLCPDDLDFSCTVIVAEIENCDNTIKWRKIGLDLTEDFDPNKIGSKVEWFEELDGFVFKKEDYKLMLSEFKKQYEIDKLKWKKQNPEFFKGQ